MNAFGNKFYGALFGFDAECGQLSVRKLTPDLKTLAIIVAPDDLTYRQV